MAENFWEQAVETYLKTDRSVFLNPQYLVGEPNVWESDVDFLALSFVEKTAWMVEVTKAPKPALFNKMNNFNAEYVSRIGGQLVRHGVVPAESAWRIGFWIFVPEAWRQKIEGKLINAQVENSRVTALEATVTLDGSAWRDRFR